MNALRRPELNTLGVIGMGHVGRQVKSQFEGRLHLVTYDKADDVPYPRTELEAAQLIYVCVDTPALCSGEADISNVVAAVEAAPDTLIAIRSTIPPGTTRELVRRTGKRIVHIPEYVGESSFIAHSWRELHQTKPFTIVGGESSHRRELIDLLLPHLGPLMHWHQCESSESELIKYMENAYFAVKLSFVREFFALSKATDLDFAVIREGWLLDDRVERDHSASLHAETAYGGRCLPKDMHAIVSYAESLGVDTPLLVAARDAGASPRP